MVDQAGLVLAAAAVAVAGPPSWPAAALQLVPSPARCMPHRIFQTRRPPSGNGPESRRSVPELEVGLGPAGLEGELVLAWLYCLCRVIAHEGLGRRDVRF